jgi:hypothetical protein
MADAVHAAFVATPQGAPSVVVVVACVYWYTDVPESAGEGGVVGVLEKEEWWGLTDTPRSPEGRQESSSRTALCPNCQHLPNTCLSDYGLAHALNIDTPETTRSTTVGARTSRRGMAPAAKYVLTVGISRIALYMAMNGASPPSDGLPPLYGGAPERRRRG